MNIVAFLSDELQRFLGIGEFVELTQKGDFSLFLSLEGIYALVSPLVPVILIYEIGSAALQGRFRWNNFGMPLFMYVFNGMLGMVVVLSIGFTFFGWVRQHVPWEMEFGWLAFIWAYLAYEFTHFLYHYSTHRVRLLWCLHSTHHAPEEMNLSVSFAHIIFESPYANFFRIGGCALLGVSPEALLIVMAIDGMWGKFIHVSEQTMPDGRLGKMQKYVLTPSHHRVHHSRNPEYIDKNFCNLLPVFDKLFGTYQDQLLDVPPDYGIKRPHNVNSFWDCYVGEIVQLARDVKNADGLANKLRYLYREPGWQPSL